jgi:hypothetical protein
VAPIRTVEWTYDLVLSEHLVLVSDWAAALEPKVGHGEVCLLDHNVAVYVLHPNPACAIGLLAFKLLLSPSRFSPCVVGASLLFALENRIGGAGVF